MHSSIIWTREFKMNWPVWEQGLKLQVEYRCTIRTRRWEYGILELPYVFVALCILCIFAIMSFFSSYRTWLSFPWNRHIIWRILWTMMAWWTLKWFEQIFSFVTLDWKVSARLQMLLWSALFYNFYLEVFFSPCCHELLRSLFLTSWHAFPLRSDHWGRLLCVMSPARTRAIPLTFLSVHRMEVMPSPMKHFCGD